MSVNDDVTRQAQSGFSAFCKFFTLSTIAVFVALGLMGLFLL